jgi:tRNA A-37 threonylcarbamoyl transferase component Bud32
MSDELRCTLLDRGELRLDEWRWTGQLTTIKDGPNRAIYRVQLSSLDLHIKQYRPRGFRSRIREMLRTNKAQQEFQRAAEIRSRGIATPEPLAWGLERTGFGQSAGWLITRTMPGTSLLELFSRHSRAGGNDGASRAYEFTQNLAAFIARLHDAGVVQTDFHPGNILVDLDSEPPRFALLDLHGVRVGEPCAWAERRENLIIFNRYFSLRASRSDRLRFWRAYVAAVCACEIPTPEQLSREIERLTLRSNRQFWTARDRRSLVSNRYFRRVSKDGLRGIVVSDLDTTTTHAILSNPDSALANSDLLIKKGRSSTVADFSASVGGRSMPAILKRFNAIDARDPWLALIRRSPVMRSWVNGHGLRERCLPTARPLAVLHRYRNGLQCESYLLTEKIVNVVELRAWLDSNPGRCTLADRIAALGRLIRQLHTRGLAHRDLKAANLLTSTSSDDHRFWFIDLVGVQRMSRIGARQRAQNLARLQVSFANHPAITRTDRVRFLRAYMAWGLRGKSGWKRWWRRIDAAALAKFERNRRSGRPIF